MMEEGSDVSRQHFPFRSGGRSLGRDLIKVYALEHLFARRSIDNVKS